MREEDPVEFIHYYMRLARANNNTELEGVSMAFEHFAPELRLWLREPILLHGRAIALGDV